MRFVLLVNTALSYLFNYFFFKHHQFSSVHFSCSVVSNSATPQTAACQASQSRSVTISQSLLRLTCIESVMPSNHLVLCQPPLLLSVFPSIRVFSNESALCIRWSKYYSFSFNISPSNEYSELISFRIDLMSWLVFFLIYTINL